MYIFDQFDSAHFDEQHFFQNRDLSVVILVLVLHDRFRVGLVKGLTV